MSTDYNNFSLNKGKSGVGKIDLENLKGGLKREQIKDKNLLAIFDVIDDGNHVLDEKEIGGLKELLKKFAKDDNLSKREADKYLQSLFGDKKNITVTNEDLFKFLDGLNSASKNVKKSETLEENGQKYIQTEYKDGSIEKYYPNDKKKVIMKDNKTTTYDKDDKPVSEEYFDENGNAVKTTFENGKIKKRVTTLKDNAGTETITYENEEPKSRLVQNSQGSELYTVTPDGEKLSKKVTKGESEQDSVTTEYNYNEDGTVNETETSGSQTTNRVRRGENVLSSTKVETLADETTVETLTDENGNITENVLNKDGKRIKQTKTVDGETYTVEYDGEGRTKIIVQNGESIGRIAKHFDVEADEVIELNSDKVKGRGSKRYFLVGEEVVIPKELEADDAKLRGRKSKEETEADYNDLMARRREERRQREQEDKRLRDEAANRKAITFTAGQKTFEALARQLFKQEGNANPSKRELELRIEELKKHNPKIKDGELQGKRVTAGVADSTYNRVVKGQKETKAINDRIKANKSAKAIAENLYQVCDDKAAAINTDAFWKELNKVNSGNIIQVLDNYDKVLEKHPGDSSLIDTICSEVGASSANRKKALKYIFEKMSLAASKAGVKVSEIEYAEKQFTDSMNKEFASIGRIDPSKMESALDFLRGRTVGAKAAKGAPEISTAEAMNKFVKGNNETDATAQKSYKDARQAEGWVAKTGDWVCGLFGCTTIGDMDKKLGKHAADAKALAAAAEAKDEVKFKKLYKQIFGIDFDPKAIQARETAQENYETAAMYDSSYKAFATLENKFKNLNYAGMRNELKKSFGYADADIDALITSYAESKGLDSASDEDKKFVLNTFIKESKNTYHKEYHKISNGKSLEQMANDVELLTKSAYGTNDIVKDVMKFNENQQMTEMITSAAFEIAGTIALQFVPGLGQVAAARLAVSAAKWGAKGIKVANMARKTYKAASVVKKAQTASKAARVGTQMVNAGVATAAVNLSNKKSVKDTMRKTLMNMSFAGVGATSSILAPKLMQSFGITNKALANEIAEEIINMAGSYGVTKVAGDNYGETDAFIDFASGLLISRLSHIKTGKTKPHGGADAPHGTRPSGDTDAPAVIPPKPSDEGGGIPSKHDSDSDLPGGVDKPSDNADGSKPVGPTPENPQHMTLGEGATAIDIDVVKIETNKQGQKVLHTENGLKLTLDAHDRPVVVKTPDGDIATYEYASADSKNPSKGVLKDKKNQIKKTFEQKGDVQIQKDFESGVEEVLDKNNVVITKRVIPLSEYPAGAKIPEPDVYSANMKKQIDECTSLDKLTELKYEYDMYNSQYGKTEDLFDVFNAKHAELDAGGTTPVKPHEPVSKLVTGTAFDNALKNLNLKKYGKKGLPLKYSHDSFMKDLNDALNKLSPAEKQTVMNNLNIKLVSENGKVELADIPNLAAKPASQAEQDVLDVLNKFAKQNEIQISDPALKAELENFIKDVPEFSFMIGKPQNGVHAYSLDSHTLQNLQKALKYADDANLSDDSKEILKMSILLHDIGKQFKGSSASDTGHAILSTQYASKILDRFNYSFSQKDKILKLIENHHWFKDFNKGKISADDVLKMFGDDIQLAKIMAKADLESVSDDFHLTILEPGKKLSQAEYDVKIKEKMDGIDAVVTPELIGLDLPIGTLKTKEPYVLDLNKVDKLKIGQVEVDFNDPALEKLISELKEGDSFAIGCTNPTTQYADVKYKIGTYEQGVGSHHVVISKKHGQLVIEARKDGVSVIKDIPTKPNSDPVISKKIDELRKKASSITAETFTVNGKPVQFEILNGTQGGSNKGYYVINKETGELFYAKFGGPQGKTELLASKLYEMAGINVPEMNSFKAPDGTNGTLSKYEPDLTKVTKATADANDGFGMDVLLANWDVVGEGHDNMFRTADGKILRLDAGGTFDYRAMGKNKPYTSVPTEITTLLDPHHNAISAEIFSKMTREDMISSLNKAVSLKDSEITKLLDDMGLTQYKEVLLKRKKFLKNLLDEVKATPQGSKSMLDYMNGIKHSTMEKMIDSAKNTDDLVDLKQALQYTNDKSVKKKLLDKIDARQKYLESVNPTPKLVQLSDAQVNNLLNKNGFIKDSYGNYTKKLTSAEKQKLYDAYGSYGSHIISKIEAPLSKSDVQNLTKMINMAGGKYVSLWQKDMNALVQLYRNMQGSQIFGLNHLKPEHWDAVFNIAKTKPITAEQIDVLTDYKGSGYMTINDALTAKEKHGTPLPSNVKSKVDKIQEYINTQVVKEPMTVYRKEGTEVLASVKLPNGKTLEQAMIEAKAHYNKTGDDTLIEQVKNWVKKGNLVATQERFMSTSYDPNVWHGELHWELEVQKGSKGVFLEGINVHGSNQGECEFLLQKDSNILITDIDFKNGHWELKGSVSN